MNKDVVISFRIDRELQGYIAFLKQKNVKYTSLIYSHIKKILKGKCKEMKYTESKINIPF